MSAGMCRASTVWPDAPQDHDLFLFFLVSFFQLSLAMTTFIYYIEYAAGLFWLAVTIISKSFATFASFNFFKEHHNQILYITNLC